MIGISHIHPLRKIKSRIVDIAEGLGMTLPEMRCFLVDWQEFICLIEKNVFPSSPTNIWEGKEVVNKRLRVERGVEPGIIYEVVQPGDPSYVYLNETNSDCINASVMAHVCGHCEFAKIGAKASCEVDRTERVLYLTRLVNAAKDRMGERDYIRYWNAAESLIPFVRPDSQYSLENSLERDTAISEQVLNTEESGSSGSRYYSSSLARLLEFGEAADKRRMQKAVDHKRQQNEIDRKGYRLRAPCEDIMGFIMQNTQASDYERSILHYLYEVNRQYRRFMHTQIMDEGWCMYWEKKIMMDMLKERHVTGAIEYLKTFAHVCYPRPFFMRNPYHLGYSLWCEIEDLHSKGKLTVDYVEEKDRDTKENWDRKPKEDTIEYMRNLVRTITDHEFLRRFLTLDLIEKFCLNRIPINMAKIMGIPPNDVYREDKLFIWIHPLIVRESMLRSFLHFGRPRVYIIDDDFKSEGGLLLYHRNDKLGTLRENWIPGTLASVSKLWKRPVHLITYDDDETGQLISFTGGSMQDSVDIQYPDFDEVRANMLSGKKGYE